MTRWGVAVLFVLLGSAASAADPLSALKALATGGGEAFLEPDRAFVSSVEAVDARTLRARFEVADGYYLYRDKLSFKIEGTDAALGAPQIPGGDVKGDPYFGKVETMHGVFEVTLPVQRPGAAAADAQVTLGYQGCAEDGICYPPITKTFPVRLPQAGAPPPAGASTPGGPGISETDRFAGLLSGGVTLGTLAAFFGVGLLLAFTPCVFPMVPILSGILIGQGPRVTTRRAFSLSLVYVLSMAFTYAAVGVAAGLLGENLQAWFQKPAVLIAFAAIFVVLAGSMFGFYELQLPSAWQTRLSELSRRQRVGSLHGVAAIGVLSAVIVGPCVAPPLAGALVYIGRTGEGLLGGLALFAMALGMGAPLLAIGASAGTLLPRAGAWMESVKKVFGVLMLGLAIWFLERVLPGPLTLALWALLLMSTAVFLGALDRLEPLTPGWRRFSKGLGLAMLVYGAALVVGAAGGHSDVLRPLAGFPLAGGPGKAAVALDFKPVRGPLGLKAALTEAGGRPVLLDFYADWCVECKKLDQETFNDQTVRQVLSKAVLLRADVTAHDEADQALLRSLDLYGPPAILFFNAAGQERRPLRLQGFVAPESFVKHLDAALAPCPGPEQLLC